MGGYRKGSGRSKSGYYKGIYCGSTYELCWVIHSLDHSISFSRFPGHLCRDGKKYFPDFLLEDGKTIVETKGYEKQSLVNVKSKIAESFGYTVKVLRKEDLDYAFEYVIKTYGTSKFYILYDGYKPKYKYACSNCNKVFEKDANLKTENKFCDRRCAGLFRKINNKRKSISEIGSYIRKFSKEDALLIFNSTKSLQSIANDFNTTKNAIWFIKTKKTYKWIHS